MTTIAFDGAAIAGDSCYSHDDRIDTLATKVKRLTSGALFGASGDNDARAFERLLDNVRTPAGLPSRDELIALRCNCLGLLVFPRRGVFKIAAGFGTDADALDDVGVWEISAPFTAIGTGADLAIGAMAAGKSASQAVRIACRFDLNSRLPVHTLKLQKD